MGGNGVPKRQRLPLFAEGCKVPKPARPTSFAAGAPVEPHRERCAAPPKRQAASSRKHRLAERQHQTVGPREDGNGVTQIEDFGLRESGFNKRIDR